MEINSFTPYVPSTDNSSLSQAKLEKAFTEKDDKELKKACQEFEATFINMLFKEMRKTVGSSDSNFALDTYQEMLDEELANSVSEGKGIGIADMMYKQLSYKLNNTYKSTRESENNIGG